MDAAVDFIPDYRRRIAALATHRWPDRAEMLVGRASRSDQDLNPDHTGYAEPRELRAAAVLVPIIERDEPWVLLTRRSDSLGSHSGQVAFPGGKIEEGEDPVNAALREAEEEIGLDRSFVEVAGVLDIYETGTGFRILPVIGFVKPGFVLLAAEAEVAEIFEVPLSFLMNPANHEQHNAVWRGERREYYAMPYEGHYIWGATAGMLKNFYDRVFAD
ncbi:MAG: CoA pyrophosphatase [Parvibaculaceae bacterium]|nr:CoA pyrophosphatase [Parvibaculaceae bacterium]